MSEHETPLPAPQVPVAAAGAPEPQGPVVVTEAPDPSAALVAAPDTAPAPAGPAPADTTARPAAGQALAPAPAAPTTMDAPLGEGQGAPFSGGWLPTLRQVRDAALLRMAQALGPEPDWPFFVRGTHSSMRQGMGLITLVLLLAGLPTMITTWLGLAADHTTLRILQVQAGALRLAALAPDLLAPALQEELGRAAQLAQGLTPGAPPQIAAGLSALSVWLALPLRGFTLWIAYGLLVLAVAKALGAGTTLPRFYAATAYAVVPLLLGLLLPVPVVGPWIAAAGVVLAVVASVLAVAAATGLDRWRAVISVLLPASVLALAALLLAGLSALTLL